MDGATPFSERSRRILIFGINYWPEEIGIAPYSTALAEHLAASGWSVTMVAGMPHYPNWTVETSYAGTFRRRETRNGVEICRLSHHVPSSQTAIRRGLYEFSFLANGLLPLRLHRPDVVLGIVPSLSGGILATRAARRFRVPCGLVVQDLMAKAAKQSGIAGGGIAARGTSAVEAWVARRADGIAVVSEAFRSTLERFGVRSDRLSLLQNWTHIGLPQRSREAVRAELGWRPGEQIVLHAGNMGLKQALEHVVAAARVAAKGGVARRFVLMGGGSQRGELQRLAAGCPSMEFLDPQPAESFPDVLAAADVLLVNERKTVFDMSLPSKLTSYFGAGRPIVAAVMAEGATAQEVERAGAGLVVPAESPQALLDALDRLGAEPDLAEQLGRAGAAYAALRLDRRVGLAQGEAFVTRLVLEAEGSGDVVAIEKGMGAA